MGPCILPAVQGDPSAGASGPIVTVKSSALLRTASTQVGFPSGKVMGPFTPAPSVSTQPLLVALVKLSTLTADVTHSRHTVEEFGSKIDTPHGSKTVSTGTGPRVAFTE